MKLILSPAKTLDFETPATTKKCTEPLFKAESKKLLADLKKLSPSQNPANQKPDYDKND